MNLVAREIPLNPFFNPFRRRYKVGALHSELVGILRLVDFDEECDVSTNSSALVQNCQYANHARQIESNLQCDANFPSNKSTATQWDGDSYKFS